MAVKRGAKGQASPAAKPKAARKAKAKQVSPAVKAAADRAEARSQPQKPKVKQPPKKDQRRVSPGATAEAAPASSALPAPSPKIGRPTRYRAELCGLVIALGSEGKSAAQIAAGLGISRQCWYEWIEAHEAFGDAVKQAAFLAQAWWEDQGQRGITMGKEFNAASWIFQMKNRFRDDYRDTQERKHDIGDGLAGLLSELDGGTGRFRSAA